MQTSNSSELRTLSISSISIQLSGLMTTTSKDNRGRRRNIDIRRMKEVKTVMDIRMMTEIGKTMVTKNGSPSSRRMRGYSKGSNSW